MNHRVPLSHWNWPSRAVLKGERYPQGCPPFAPFPTVTDVITARLCPVAAYHSLIHGLDALEEQRPWGRDLGNHFHDFIAELRIGLASERKHLPLGPATAQEEAIRQWLIEYVERERVRPTDAAILWSSYIEPWVRRKLGDRDRELQDLPGRQIITEIDVTHPRVPFVLESGERRYALRGRIDELDLTRRCLIERTSRGSSSDTLPPSFKDYQVWLLSKILRTLGPNQLPHEWEDLMAGSWNIVVETPHQDFIISDETPYLSITHEAVAWIHDIADQPQRSWREVRANRACGPENPNRDCRHPFFNCFSHPPTYPQSRAEMRHQFRRWFPPLLYEQMWEDDLWHYRLVMLEREELIEQALVFETTVVDVSENRVVLEVLGPRARALRGRNDFIIVLGGTLYCGPRVRATVVDAQDSRITVQLERPVGTITGTALLLPQGSEADVLDQPLRFLVRNEQARLFRLQYMGCSQREAAERISIVQLLEAIFGRRSIYTGGGQS